MKSKIEPNKIARTGRVQQWIENPENRLPVSCTIFNVDDSMEGSDGIEASWRFVSHALRFGAGVAVHLSDLRPAGTETNKGCLLYTSPSPRDRTRSRMPSSA